MTTILDALSWRTYDLPGDAAHGSTPLRIGTAGSGAPTALITAGIHGDEGPWGAYAIRRLVSETPVSDLIGTLRVVPCANPLAMAADARNAPLDTLDLNRTFPGNPNGSHTEALAALLTAEALPDCDVAIDLHGGGSWCVNSFAFVMQGGESLSEAFGAPFLVTAPDRTVTLTGYARSQGARVCAVEMGGRSDQEGVWAERIAAGLRRALIRAGVLRGTDDPPPSASIRVGDTHVLRPKTGGMFVPVLKSGDIGTIVPQGTLLGEILDPGTMAVRERLVAPYARTAVLLLRPHLARIEGGAMTYVVAQPVE